MKRFVLVAVLIALTACRNHSEQRISGAQSFGDVPVILLSIDTLRADRLSIYGGKEVQTPAFAALAKESITFDAAYSHVPLTLPSHVSMFTGLLPPQNGVRDNIGFTLDATKHPTLAAKMKAAGYSTGGAVSSYVLKHDSGVSAGFDAWDDDIKVIPGAVLSNLYRRGEETINIAHSWISSHRDQKFFYFLHLYEPHAPYEPPEPYKSRYRDPYDGEVAYSDALLGGFVEWLKQNDLYDRALVIVVSDHGEGLMDHGEQEHGIFLYRDTIHVPLLVKLPKAKNAGTRVATPVELRQVFTTILGAVGIKTEADAAPSLLATAAATPDPDRAVYSESLFPRIHLGWSDLRSLVTGRHHYIDAPKPELYDVAADPNEKKNVLESDRRPYARLRKLMADQYPASIALPQNVDPEEAAKLAALGYISAAKPTAESNLPDPKERIADLEKVKDAFKLAAHHQYPTAIAELKTIVEENPRWTDAWSKLAGCYEALGDYESAASTYRRAIEVAPTLASEYALSLAGVLVKLGQFDDAAKHAELALRQNPGGAHQLLGEIALSRNDLVTAHNEAALTMQSTQYRLEGEILDARVDSAAGRLQEALAKLETLERDAAAAHRLPFANLDFVRGDTLARMNQNEAAITAFRREIASFPQNRQAYANLAIVQLIVGRQSDAYDTLEQMAAANPDRHTYLFAAKTLDTLGDKRGAALWRSRAQSVQ